MLQCKQVNNAGVFIPKPFTEYTTEDFRKSHGNKPLGILLCFATCSITDAPSEVRAYRQHHIVNSGPARRGTHGQCGQSDCSLHGRIGDRVCTRWSTFQLHFSWSCEHTNAPSIRLNVREKVAASRNPQRYDGCGWGRG